MNVPTYSAQEPTGAQRSYFNFECMEQSNLSWSLSLGVDMDDFMPDQDFNLMDKNPNLNSDPFLSTPNTSLSPILVQQMPVNEVDINLDLLYNQLMSTPDACISPDPGLCSPGQTLSPESSTQSHSSYFDFCFPQTTHSTSGALNRINNTEDSFKGVVSQSTPQFSPPLKPLPEFNSVFHVKHNQMNGTNVSQFPAPVPQQVAIRTKRPPEGLLEIVDNTPIPKKRGKRKISKHDHRLMIEEQFQKTYLLIIQYKESCINVMQYIVQLRQSPFTFNRGHFEELKALIRVMYNSLRNVSLFASMGQSYTLPLEWGLDCLRFYDIQSPTHVCLPNECLYR